jgi:hypothetical protein
MIGNQSLLMHCEAYITLAEKKGKRKTEAFSTTSADIKDHVVPCQYGCSCFELPPKGALTKLFKGKVGNTFKVDF